jgi:hypothetical protein
MRGPIRVRRGHRLVAALLLPIVLRRGEPYTLREALSAR